MRYFHFTPEVEEIEPQTKQSLKVNSVQLFKDVLCAEAPLSTPQFFRMSDLFKKLDQKIPGEVLEIEDQDYDMIQIKLEAYVKSAKGFAAALPSFVAFVKLMQNMPTTDPRQN